MSHAPTSAPQQGQRESVGSGDLFGISSTGNKIITVALKVMGDAVATGKKKEAQLAMRALRTATKGRHNWWSKWVTPKNAEVVRKQVGRETYWLRRLQATVNFMPNNSGQTAATDAAKLQPRKL